MSFIVESLPIAKITVGARRREKVGSLTALKSSLERVAQIHPITVRPTDDGYELVAGERRLKAAESLGWKSIRARVGKFTDEQLREIELDENTARLDLTDFEASAAKLKQIAAAEKEAMAEIRPESGRKSKGRPSEPGSVRDIAARTGFKRTEVQETKRHVSLAEEHPTFQGKDWKRSQVLAAGEALEKLPEREQRVAVEMVSEPGVPPKTAVKMLETIAERPKDERRELLDLYRSEKPADRELAKTRAAKLPPAVPESLGLLRDAIRTVERSLNYEDTVARQEIRSALASLRGALKENEQSYQALRKREGF